MEKGLRAQLDILEDAPFPEIMERLSKEWEELTPAQQEAIINALAGESTN